MSRTALPCASCVRADASILFERDGETGGVSGASGTTRPVTNVMLTVQSPAKINWHLRVLGRREDGFHELESLVSTVTLFDQLTFTSQRQSGIDLSCNRMDLPTDQRNLIVQAGQLLADSANGRFGAACQLSKQIPVGGGMGGGSSNAAAALTALNRLWDLNQPIDQLEPLAAQLGSDVSLFLAGGSAVIRGRGEQVTPVELPWRGWIVLLVPAFSISTADVYRAWTPGESAPDATIMEALTTGQAVTVGDAADWMGRAFNMLEPAVVAVCPAMRRLMDEGAAMASRPVRVSGSGSTLFTAFDSQPEAKEFAQLAGERLDVQTHVVQPLEQVA